MMLNLKFLATIGILAMVLGWTSWLENNDSPQIKIIMGEVTQVEPSHFQGIINDLMYNPAMIGSVSNTPLKRTWSKINSGKYNERIINKPITDIVFEIDQYNKLD